MTEIDVTRVGKWWNSVRRFVWSGFGVLSIVGGVVVLIRDGNQLWGWMFISGGITFAVVPLTTVRCSKCGSPTLFEQVWKTVYKRQQFTCHACGAQYRMSQGSHILLNIIVYGYGFLILASGCNQFAFNFIVRAPDYLTFVGGLPFAWALEMLVVRFAHYERLESA